MPDGDAPPEEKLNMRQLNDLFKNTNSQGLVSLPFLGLIKYCLEENDHSLIKSAISELYLNLSYTTLSGTRDFRFDDVSELTARLSILLKYTTLGSNDLREIENETLAKKINEERTFDTKIEDPLDEVVKIINVPDIEHKKSMFPYVEPTFKTADEIETNQQIIDDDFIDPQTKFDQVNDVVTEQKNKQTKKIEETIESVVDDTNPFSTFDDFWWEDEMFSERDLVRTVEASKNILEDINEISDNVFRNFRPVDTRTEQEIIEDQHIPIDDRTQHELEDGDYLSFESEDIKIENIDTTSAWDEKKSTAAKPGQIFKLLTDFNKKIREANKIKNKYLKKKIGQREKSNKISTEWLKTAGYLDTKDQDKINYIFIAPKTETSNNIPADAAHFIRTNNRN